LLNKYTANRREEYNGTILINASFKSYCFTKNYDDNTIVITTNQLMEAALKMYQTKIQCRTWEQDPTEYNEVINLAAQFNAFKKNLKQG
jgi:hypothetical protein